MKKTKVLGLVSCLIKIIVCVWIYFYAYTEGRKQGSLETFENCMKGLQSLGEHLGDDS